MKPLSPKEVVNKAQTEIPDCVIEAVNNLLIKKCRDGRATILQDDIVKEIERIKPSVNRHDLFDNGWMDFEPVFRKSGWTVTYDSPAYCEDYAASFTFKRKK